MFDNDSAILPNRAAPASLTAALPALSRPDLAGDGDSGGTTDGGANEPIPPPSLDGYRFLNCLGRGGMGTVWRATQLSTGRDVAVKVMSAAGFGSDRARLRFEREVELSARLEHPHIARVYDSGLQRGYCFYSMQLVDGGVPLDEFVRARGLGRRHVVGLLLAVCRAVQHAHQKGIIHRDLKPANVLVDVGGQPHVLDFGLARALSEGRNGETLSLDGEVAGTLGFISPEQAAGRGDRADTRTDVYALGAILYHLLTGRPPHLPDGPPLDVLRRVRDEDVLPPRRVAPAAAVDAELEAVLLKALARDAADRYASAAELADDVERYLRGDPLSARPATLAYFVRRRARRHRAPLLVAAGVAAALLAMGVVNEVKLRRERDAAVTARRRAEDLARQKAEQQAAAERAAEAARQSEAEAKAARRRSDVSLAESLLAQGDALAEGEHWVEAKRLYVDARDRLAALAEPTFAADVALTNAYVAAPPPLLRFGRPADAGGGHAAAVTATAVAADGRVGASGGADGTVMVWDLVTGGRLAVLAGHADKVRSLAFSPDGRLLVSGSNDRTVRLWDVAAGREQFRLRGGGAGPEAVTSVAYSADGRRCAAAGAGGYAEVWDAGTGRRLFRRHQRTRDWFLAVALSGDGRRVVAGDEVWDVDSGDWVRTLATLNVLSAAMSPDGRRAVLGRTTGIVDYRTGARPVLRLVDVETGEARDVAGHRSDVTRVAFAADGAHFLSAASDGTIRTHRVDGAEEGRGGAVVHGDGAAPDVVSFSADGRLALSSDGGRGLCLWDTAGDGGAAVLRGVHYGPVKFLAVGAGGRLAVTGSDDNFQAVWDLATGRRVLVPTAHIPAPGLLDLAALSPDGRWLLAATRDSPLTVGYVVRPWDAVAGRVGPELCRVEYVRSLAFSPDGELALVASGNDLRVFDTATWRQVNQFRSYWTLTPGVTFGRAPDGGTCLAGASTHGGAAFWHLPTGLHYPGPFGWTQAGDVGTNVAFTPDLRTAVAGTGPDVRVWDAGTGARMHTFTGHRATVRAVAVSPDGRWAASAADDYTVKLWDLGRRRLVRTFTGHAGGVTTVAFTPDGGGLVSGGNDRTVRAWHFARGPALLAFGPRLDEARRRLAAEPGDGEGWATLGEWYALRGMYPWAAECLERARAGGRPVSSLLLGRCYWMTDDTAKARREFQSARGRREAPEVYQGWLDRAVAPAG